MEPTGVANLDLCVPGIKLSPGGGSAEGQTRREWLEGDDDRGGGEETDGGGELHFEYCLVVGESVNVGVCELMSE